MKSNKKRILFVLAILTMALVLSCALVACNKTDSPDAPKKEFTITFDTRGGSEVKPITIAEGATITLPRNPTKEGYIFDGWYLSDEFIEKFNATQTISSNITVYAKWRELVAGEEFNVTFNLNYGTDNIVEKLTENQLITYIPVRQGYRFTGWYYSDGYVEDIGYILTEKYDTTIPVTQNGLVLYAEWVDSSTDSRQLASPTISVNGTVLSWDSVPNADKYELKFYLGKNLVKTYYTTQSSTDIDSVGIDAGTYTLKARSIGDGVSHINSVETIKHISYKVLLPVSNAKIDVESSILTWTEANNATTYTVYIDGTRFEKTYLNSVSLSKLNAGQYVIKIVAERAGYTSSNATFTLVKSRLLTPKIKIERQPNDNYSSKISWSAIYNANQYVVVVDKKEVATTSNNYYILNDSDWGSNKKVSVSVYAKDSSADYLVSIPSEISTVTRTAKIAVSHNIRNVSLVKVIGKSYSSTDNLIEDYSSANNFYVGVDFGEPKKVVAIPQNGYTWLGWYDKSGQLISTKTEYIFDVDTSSSEIVAHWASYSVALNKNDNNAGKIGFSADMSTQNTLSQRIMCGNEVTIYAKTNNGYTWLGWYKGDEKVSDEQTYTFAMGDSDIAYTAKWSKTTISVSSSSAGSVSGLNATYKVGDKVTVTAVTNNGYTWLGWYKGDEKVSDEQTYTFAMGDSDIAYTAKWSKTTISVSSSSAGSVSGLNATYKVGDKVTVTAVTNNGYTWDGWYLNGEKVSSDLQYEIQITEESLQYVATWKYYTLTTSRNINVAGSISSYQNQKVTVGDSVELVASTNDGYTWLGWYDGETLLTSDLSLDYTMTAENKVLTAKWTYYTLSTACNNSNAGAYTIYNNQKITVGNLVALTATTNDGYTWLGWYDGDTLVSSDLSFDYTMTAANTTLTAKWTPILYSISYTLTKDENIDVDLVDTYTIESANIKLPHSNNGQYFIDCWYDADKPNEFVQTIKTGSTGDRVLVGHVASYGLLYSGNLVTGIGSFSGKELIIPFKNGSTAITAIGELAFKDQVQITSIVIPDSVTSIGRYAFYGCTGLTSVTIGNSVTSIGAGAFAGCTELTSITVAKGNTKYHSAENCLIETESKTLIAGCKNSIIPTDGSVTSIGDYAFRGCTGLTSITIPDSVKSIGDWALYGCTGLTSITIPDSVTSIGWDAFYGCIGLTTVNWNATACTRAGSSDYPIFKGCSNLATVNIGDNVKIIPSLAFYNCTGLTSVTIPDSVTSIGPAAFGGCSSLESITIPFVGAKAGVTSSDTYQYPFGYIFGTSSYAGGVATEQYYYGSSTSSTTYKTYYIPSSLKSVTVTGGNILYGAFRDCTGLTSVTIPDSVTSIGDGAFYGCTGLMSVTIPDNVTSIGGSAFDGCTGLTSVTIGNSVTSIGSFAFYGCTGLTSITVVEGNSKYHSAGNCLIETATNTLILGCKTSVIPTDGSVTSIGSPAFQNCTGLTSVTIPDSVTSIGSYAFYGCTRLTRITFKGTIKQWNAISKGSFWKYDVPSACKVICTDGTISI